MLECSLSRGLTLEGVVRHNRWSAHYSRFVVSSRSVFLALGCDDVGTALAVGEGELGS